MGHRIKINYHFWLLVSAAGTAFGFGLDCGERGCDNLLPAARDQAASGGSGGPQVSAQVPAVLQPGFLLVIR